MDGGVDWRSTAIGFLAALAVLAGLLWLVGVEEVVRNLVRARAPPVIGMFGVATVWIFLWGLALRVVLGAMGDHITPGESFLAFAGAMFSNNVTPFGQAGGEPVSALLISSVADNEYETSLASIASVDALHFVPSLGFAVVGIAYFAMTVTVSQRLKLVATAVVALSIGLPILGVVAWHRRYRIERAAIGFLAPVIRAVTRVIPGIETPTRRGLESRIEGFFRAIERIAGDRETIALALLFAALGWLCLMGCLWLAVYAMGVTISPAAAVVAIPVGALASITPLPGGSGAIETILVAVLVTTTPLSAATAASAAILHRVVTYWYPIVLGGGAAAMVGSGLFR